MLDQRKSIIPGIVQPILIGLWSLVVLKMIRMLGLCHVIPKMKGISELGRSCRLCRFGIGGTLVVATGIRARLRVPIFGSV
ncbi:hypothetical protein A5906_38185 [Bradyrhizobium sacchari]|nr:hypothetical protein A5906_38185 [Bradyrhizobium sacchari]